MDLKLGGMISSPMFKENIAIVVEDNPSTIDYDFACLGYTKKKTAPRVMMKRNFFEDLKCGTPESRMILFHEIGHYSNGDILTNDGNNDAEREALVSDNKVSEKSTWNFELLDEELKDLDLDMSDYGFENIDIDLDIDDSQFVQDTEITKTKEEPKEIICPNCGEKITL